MELVLLAVCSSWKSCKVGFGFRGGVAGNEEKVNFSHQSPSDISNNSNLESITKTNKDIAGESTAGTSDGGTGYVN